MTPGILSVDRVWFTVLGYPMSYLEFLGTVFNVWAVWLMIRRNVWTWPVGVLAVLLFGALFYQIRLYSDLFEQAYYLAANAWGWWLWTRGASGSEPPLEVSRNGARLNAALAAFIAAASFAAGWAASRLHLWLPALFPQPASFPYLDALTSVMGLVAQTLAAHKRLENWHLWIAVNALSVWIYYRQGVHFVALLYGAFLLMAFKGLADWTAGLAPSKA